MVHYCKNTVWYVDGYKSWSFDQLFRAVMNFIFIYAYFEAGPCFGIVQQQAQHRSISSQGRCQNWWWNRDLTTKGLWQSFRFESSWISEVCKGTYINVRVWKTLLPSKTGSVQPSSSFVATAAPAWRLGWLLEFEFWIHRDQKQKV